MSVAVDGNYLYVADHSFGLQVIDISVPVSPIRSSFETVMMTPDFSEMR
ncbi:MAG: hypothetical protein QNL91_08035 [Candidatus Krumholzibacteria bacterium]|nr:hypothetical protein [Candidatus Krumholzibacteria bacterium]